MADATPDRAALEAHWRQRLEDARLRVDFGRQDLTEVQRDFNDGTVLSPNGSYAYQKAMLAERHALAEYRRVFRVYTDLVVEGKVPDDSASA